MKIGEFFIDLFVDGAKGELTIGNLVKSMGALEVASVGEIAVLAELATKLQQITMESINASVSLKDYTAITGGSSEALQKWQSAASHVQLTGQQVAQVFKSISQNLELGHLGKGYGSLQSALNFIPGIGAKLAATSSDKPEELLKFIRNSPEFQAMSAARKQAVLHESGLDVMQRALTQGPGGISNVNFEKFSKETGIISKAQIERYNDMASALTTFENTSVRIGRIIAAWFSPMTLAFLNKEADALVIIADYLDTLSSNKKVTGTLGGAESAGMKITEAVTGVGSWGPVMDIIKNGLKADLSPVAPMIGHGQAPVNKSVTVHARPTINVNGSNLGPLAMTKAIRDALDVAFQGLPAQINLGPT